MFSAIVWSSLLQSLSVTWDKVSQLKITVGPIPGTALELTVHPSPGTTPKLIQDSHAVPGMRSTASRLCWYYLHGAVEQYLNMCYLTQSGDTPPPIRPTLL